MLKQLKILIALFFIPVFLSAQYENMKFEHLTVEGGLSNNNVYCILQDRLGFMWFGTGNGLNRYDGYDFSQFKTAPADSNSISDNTIYSICEDRFGNLWIGTSDGLNLFDRIKEKFYCYRHNPKNSKSLPHNSVYSIIEDKDSNLWIGTADGLAFLPEPTLANIHNNKILRRQFF